MLRRSFLAALGLSPIVAAGSGPGGQVTGGLVNGGATTAPLGPFITGEAAAEFLPPPQVMKIKVDAGRIETIVRETLARHGIALDADLIGFVDGDGI